MKKSSDIFFNGFCDENILEQTSLNCIKDAKKNNELIGVALSGGSDSVFLLCVAIQICSAKNLVAFHFNHKVRKNAEGDESFVKNFCKKFGVKLVIGFRKKNLIKVNEANLKTLRENFLKSQAEKLGVKKILQGHIKSDVAETMLMRLMRASSLDGLCAPRPISKKGELTYLRPLLNLNKCDTQKILKEKNIDWREDESNFKNDFLRNKLRNIIIPEIVKIENSDFFNACIRSRMLLQQDADFIENIFRKSILKISKNSIELNRDFATEKSILRRAILHILSLNNLELRSNAVDEFIEDCLKSDFAKIQIASFTLQFTKATSILKLLKNTNRKILKQALKIGQNILSDGSSITVEKIKISNSEFKKIKNGEYPESNFAHIKILEELFVRAYKPKDAYAPIASNSPRLIKDMMSAKKTPILKRKSLPLVCYKNSIIWVPTLAPADDCKITQNSDALRLTYFERI